MKSGAHAAAFGVATAAFLIPGPAKGAVPQSIERTCMRAASTPHPGFQITSARMFSRGSFTATPDQQFALPSTCRIVGVARPTHDSQIGFELWLPDRWTGRYVQLGNGGFAGNIDQPSLANETRRGNAAAMTDTGHKASQFDASWAIGHPEKVVDYGYRSIKVTADAAKELIREFYGRLAGHRYFIGCSNGGRQALMAAQRFPRDWDGVLAGSPPVQWTRQLASFAAIQHRLRATSENWIPTSKLSLIQRVAAADCAAQETRSNILNCRVDRRHIVCHGPEQPNCLTAAQAATLDLIQSGPRNARGRRLYFGFDPTAAAVPNNWDQWIVNPDRDTPSQLTFATQAYRYLILDQPDWQIGDLDVGHDLSRASDRMIVGSRLSTILDPDDSDLGSFQSDGGKLIMYVGSADALVSPAAALTYYQNLVRHTGGLAKTRRFARLFVVPGMQHCQGGLAPNAFGQSWIAPGLSRDPDNDIRLALEAWVERDRTPQSITAAKYDEDRPSRGIHAIRQLRAYPGRAGPISALNR